MTRTDPLRARGVMVALTLGLVLSAAAAEPAAVRATVNLTERSTVAGPRIRLGLLARIDAADAALSKQLDQVQVGLAPAPGESRFLERSEIEQALALAGFPPWDIDLTGALRVELVRVSQLVPESRMTRALGSALARELRVPEAEIEFRRLELATTPRVGGGNVVIDVEFLNEPRFEQPIAARIVMLVDGVPSAQVEAELQATRRSPAMIGSSAPPRTSTRSRRVVRSGQQVTMELEGPGLLITAVGKARSSGGVGDAISVENTISGIVVRGVIKGEGRVQVYWSPITGLEGVTER